VLLDFADQYGVSTHDGIELRIDLSHDDIANFVGSTRESATVELGKLRAARIISSRRRKLVMHDLDALRELVFRESNQTSDSLRESCANGSK
jgi:CRP/FNR family transcriptional regulator